MAGILDTPSDTGDFEIVLPFRSDGIRPPLFCVHPAEGLSWRYAGLAEHLPPDYPLYGLQARGLSGKEAMPQSIEEMAADYLTQIRAIQPSGPYHLLGWSFGGLVAHAMATQLQDQGERVALLTILDGYPMVKRARKSAPVEQQANTPATADPDVREAADANEESQMRGGEIAGGPLDEDSQSGAPIDVVSAIRGVVANNRKLTRNFMPGCFRGDLLLFVATAGRPEHLPASEAPAVWEPYIDGWIESYEVDAEHTAITQREALSQIGPLISGKLQEIADGGTE